MVFLSMLKNIFQKKTNYNLKQNLNFLSKQPFTWISISINNRPAESTHITRDYDFKIHNDQYSIRLDYLEDNTQFQLAKNSKVLSEEKDKEVDEQLKLLEKIIRENIDNTFKDFVSQMKKDNDSIASLQDELRGLEWIKSSFVVLEKAIIESYSNPDLLFQLKLFLGRNPKTNMLEIRIIIFNLDIQLGVLADGKMRIKIFDDKQYDFGSSKKPVMQGDYSSQKITILNEIIKLIGLLSHGINP